MRQGSKQRALLSTWTRVCAALSIVLTPLLSQAAANCPALFNPKPAKIAIEQTITHWVTPMHTGAESLLVVPPYKQQRGPNRRVYAYQYGAHGLSSFSAEHTGIAVYLMPGAQEHKPEFYSISSFDRKANITEIKLYDLTASESLKNIVEVPMNLTWTQYAAQGTVGEKDRKSFQSTEDALSPQRKTMFVTTMDQPGPLEVVATMRLYDGSPDPGQYMGARIAAMNRRAMSDAAMPVERRYPHINFRTQSDFVYEAGRLAAVTELENAMKHQFYSMGAYLETKYGYDGAAPKEYLSEGRLYAEITAAHLLLYMTPVSKGGLGFQLFAQARDGKEMELAEGDASYKSLGIDRRHETDRFILYKPIAHFIEDFYAHSPMRGAKRNVPSVSPRQNGTPLESPFDKKYHRPIPPGFKF